MSKRNAGILDNIRGSQPVSSQNIDGLAAGLYQTYARRGITDVERVHGRIDKEYLARRGISITLPKDHENETYVAYRDGSTMIVSDEICRYETPTLGALARWASIDPKLAYTTVHEAEERDGPPEYDDMIHRQVHVDALKDLARLGYGTAVKAGIEMNSHLPWGRLSYSDLNEILGSPYALYQSGRPTGQPTGPLPPSMIAGSGAWLELTAAVERAAWGRLQDPSYDPVYGLLSFLANEMEATGYGLSPISKVRPTGITFTLGPRQPERGRDGEAGQAGRPGRDGAGGIGGGGGYGGGEPIIINNPPRGATGEGGVGGLDMLNYRDFEMMRCVYDKQSENSAWFGNLRQDAERAMREGERFYHRMVNDFTKMKGSPLIPDEGALIYDMTLGFYATNDMWSSIFNRDAEGFHGLGIPVRDRSARNDTEN